MNKVYSVVEIRRDYDPCYNFDCCGDHSEVTFIIMKTTFSKEAAENEVARLIEEYKKIKDTLGYSEYEVRESELFE